MYCPSCGTEVKSDYNVCPKCGCILNKAQMQSIQENSHIQSYQTSSVTGKVQQSTAKDNKKNKILIIVIASIIVLGVGIAFLVYFISEGNKKARIEEEKQAKADDITAAGTICTSASAALANEAAYDDYMSYVYYNNKDGKVIAVARMGEPFEAVEKNTLNTFLKEFNSNFTGGKAPLIHYKENVFGWVPQGWAIALSDKKPYCIVYITDGTTQNMVEIYPTIPREYQ